MFTTQTYADAPQQSKIFDNPPPTAQCQHISSHTPITNRANQSIVINSDNAEIRDDLYVYSGNVVIHHADQELKANQITYNHNTVDFEARDNFVYRDNNLEISGNNAFWTPATDSGVIHDASYLIADSHASGEAKYIEKLGSYINRYTNVTYTTCDPNNKSWYLAAEEIETNDITGWGVAKNAVVLFQDIPILYSQQYSFPMDERRKSGFLFPTLGYKKNSGTHLNIPYYWNISPNRDAVLTPQVITKRGTRISGSLRYLNPNNTGEIAASLLPNDDIEGSNRHHITLIHDGTYKDDFGDPIKYGINYSSLSDKNYYTDFGNSIRLSSTDRLEQTATLRYAKDQWDISALLSDHYSVNNIASSDEPYRRLPQIDASWFSQKGNDKLNYGVDGQLVHFTHPDASKAHAERYWIRPTVDYNYTFFNDSVFIKPRLTVSHSHYELNNSSVDMTVPNPTVEAGIFLERNRTNLAGITGNYLQTLEPRIKFSYIPDNKDSGQNFDTSTGSGNSGLDLSEFYGKDSAPHTKQIMFEINSDIIRGHDQQKLMQASLKRTRDFKNNRERNWSNLVGKINTSFGSHHASLALHLDNPHDDWSDTVRANYQFDNKISQLFNIGYINEHSNKKQIDISAAWKLNPQWIMFGHYNHELMSSKKRRLEDLIGFKYDTCCWSASFTSSKHFIGSGNYDTNWFITLELKGLGRTRGTDSLNSLLTDSIIGYSPE